MRKLHGFLLLPALLLLATACNRGGLTTQQMQAGMQSMEMRLNDIAVGKAEPTDMTVILDDTHPLHGGVKFSLHGSGFVEKEDHNLRPLLRSKYSVSVDRMRSLAQMLLDIRAWEQQTPSRDALADESRTTLVIHIGAMRNEIWEWHNELLDNQRLEKIRGMLNELCM